MNKFFRILFKILGIGALAIIAIAILVISIESEKVPEIVIFTESKTANAQIGNYKWYAFSGLLSETKKGKDSYNFKIENTLLLAPQETFTIANSQAYTTRHRFTVDNIRYEDSKGGVFTFTNEEISNAYSDNNYLEVIAPEEEGTYLYYFTLRYAEKGTVDYAFKLVVSSEPTYDFESLNNYRSTSLVDTESINEIINILPYSKNKTNIIIQSTSTPTKLIINYSELVNNREDLIKNALAMFALIPEVDMIEYNSIDQNYLFTRDELELKYKRHLEDYANNFSLWESEVIYGECEQNEDNTKYILLSKIIKEVLKSDSGDFGKVITINTASFEENSIYKFDRLDRELALKDLSSNFENIYDMPYKNYESINQKHSYIEAEPLEKYINPSGDDIIELDENGNVIENKSNDIAESEAQNPLTLHDNELYILVRKNNIEEHYSVKCYYVNGEWQVFSAPI